MAQKIAKFYKFTPETVDLIDRLKCSPQYASATHLLELLIYQEALRVGLITNGDGDDGKDGKDDGKCYGG